MPDPARPLVTIGIAAYNAEASLEAAVDSALAQTWRPVEIVIVDDCSADGTAAIVERLQRAHAELRSVRLPTNGGVAVVRNRIVREARGEFLAFFDDDDRSDPARIELQVERILNYERRFAAGAPVICHTARRVVHPDGQIRVERTMGQLEDHAAPAGPSVAARILVGRPLADGVGACPTCSQMARVGVYRSLGGFDESLRRSEDTEFNIRLARAGGHFVGVARPLVTQVMTPTAEKSLAEEHRNLARIMDKHRDFIAANGNYEFCVRWNRGKYAWLARNWSTFLAAAVTCGLSNPLLTCERILQALPNRGLNLAFSRFHLRTRGHT